MRIVSGKYGKRRFQTPSNFKGRPTTDMAKEGLFNILSHRIELEGLRVLDLFAGTGSIGLEFLSRGASHVDAIEKDFRHIAFIKSVVEELGDPNYKVFKKDVLHFIKENTEVNGIDHPYDLIFADPPYKLQELPELPSRILNSHLLASDGLLIVEHPRDVSFEQEDGFEEVRSYGSVHFSFFVPSMSK
ncbi:16S rRNA (guanine(966)-N(2))-methyltransferase RsmD [Porphyromonadaceae bacterium W3.11]|nr:16S rRNA (guanine(966)-N(2))-methyltransferase RsmD [Porphyromonadaceae bacterium W3.11]